MPYSYNDLNTNLESLLPELIVLVFALIILFVDLFTRGRERKSGLLAGISIVGYLLAAAVCIIYYNNWLGSPFLGSNPVYDQTTFAGMVTVDNLGLFFKVLSLGTAIITVLFSTRFAEERGLALGEYYAVLALCTMGMMITAAAVDLTALFVGIELMSISVYILTGFARSDRLSNEAAIKYFLLGIFSTAILVYGMAWLYGSTGHTNLRAIGGVVGQIVGTSGDASSSGWLMLAIFLLVAGLGFKIAAVPFHMWTPDAYQGAPTPITAFMSVGPKAIGFVALIRIMVEALGPAWPTWTPVIVVLSVLTMTLGNIVGVVQRSVKRMLAYSSIAHTGYMLIGLAAFTPQNQEQAISSILFYLFSYMFMNMGAFGIVIWMQRNGLTDDLENFRGLSSWAPGQAGLMLFFLVSLMGIPPTIGFLGKYYVFVAALDADLAWLAVIGVLNSAIAAFYYLRIVWYMYFEEPRTAREARPSPTLQWTLVASAIAVVAFFIFSWPIVELAKDAVFPAAASLFVGGGR
jgi:NADH-quinone oxidoreductase subunit N